VNLTRTNWPLGYIPSADPVNGDPTGLIRMDNCYLDEVGVLSLCRGIQRLTPSPLSNYPYRIYSKILSANTEAIWAALGITSSQIIRTAKGDFSDTVVIGNGTDKAAFGDCLGEVLCFAGTTRLKDDSVNVYPLGLATPKPPSIETISQPTLNINGTWTCPVGTLEESGPSGAYVLTTETAVNAIILNTLSGKLDTTLIGGAAADDPLQDTIQFDFIPDDPSNITFIKMEFILDANNAYFYDFDPTTLMQGPQQLTTLSVNRGSFARLGHRPTSGQGSGPDWTAVTAVRFTIQANYQMNVTCQNIIISGGIQGQINGTYQYIQVNVRDNGYYQAKSAPSAALPQLTILNGNVILIPSPTESQVNQIWFYRYGGTLDQYYQVGMTTPGVPFTDNQSDATILDVDIPLNPFLVTIQPTGDATGLNDTIYMVEGLFYDRMLYMGLGFIYISDSLNPDAIDNRYTIKAFGDPSEKNLWIKKITNNVCLLGTSKNLYELTGTFQPLPDGTIDVSINPIGENHPPITDNVCASQGTVFYMAADGVRVTTGSNSTLVSQQLLMLFQGQTRADIPPFVISSFADYPMTVGKTRLYVSIPSIDGTQRMFVYNFLSLQSFRGSFNLVANYWRFQDTDPISMFTTQTDRVLLGYNAFAGTTGGDIYQADVGLGFTDNTGAQISGFPLEFRTVFDANQQPRNRKDTFTLKLIVDTGNVSCSAYIALDKEGSPYQFVGDFQTNGLETVYFPLNNFTLGFRYSVRIVDNGSEIGGVWSAALLTFKLYEVTIEYDPRPEQLDYMRIQPNNLGTISRKRIVNYAFVIDTLGNDITFTPLIDNSNSGILPATRIVNTPTKQTYIYYFEQEQIGTDINGILSGGVFEFYGPNLEEIISEKMPVPCQYLVIPNNDYGTPDRKRHSSYKFQINTRGQGVQFTPKLDGVLGSPVTYTTTEKRIVEYFFTTDTIAREVGGILEALTQTPFEFYGVVTPEQIEKLPPRLEYFRIPNNNLGVAANKRIRTIPLVIDTYGYEVQFDPIVDGVIYSPSTVFQTTGKTTVLHYFVGDVFGIDIGGQLTSLASQPFEFYGLGQFENVETLPVGKLFDQIGPLRFDKIGKLFAFRIRMVSMGNTDLDTIDFPYSIYGDSSGTFTSELNPIYSGTFPAMPGIDYSYEVLLPKSINSNLIRLVLGPVDQPFHRYDVQIKVSQSGMESDSRWIPMR